MQGPRGTQFNRCTSYFTCFDRGIWACRWWKIWILAGKQKIFKCDECVPRGPESLPTKFHLLMFSIYRGIGVKKAELSFGTPCMYACMHLWSAHGGSESSGSRYDQGRSVQGGLKMPRVPLDSFFQKFSIYYVIVVIKRIYIQGDSKVSYPVSASIAPLILKLSAWNFMGR